MGFASAYLNKHLQHARHILTAPEKNVAIIVIIPAFREPDITQTLDSLANCTPPSSKVEIIVHVNQPWNASGMAIKDNQRSIRQIERWQQTKSTFFHTHLIQHLNIPIKNAGAGYARKIAMDEALYRFNIINNENGIIVSLDADTLVDENYFIELEHFQKVKQSPVAILHFEHPLSGNKYNLDIYKAITLYELHLRYFIQGLKYCGFPYPFHTLGSCFAVKALAYAKEGGMNKKTAGEDFYFLHKLFPQGPTTHLVKTTVRPSPRPSDRVPFGTGPAIRQYIRKKELLTYSPESFSTIHEWFKIAPSLYHLSHHATQEKLKSLPVSLQDFLKNHEFDKKIMEINQHTSHPATFQKRLQRKFGAFEIVKYLNYAHQKYFKKKPINEAALELLSNYGEKTNNIMNNHDLLLEYRKLQKNTLSWNHL